MCQLLFYFFRKKFIIAFCLSSFYFVSVCVFFFFFFYFSNVHFGKGKERTAVTVTAAAAAAATVNVMAPFKCVSWASQANCWICSILSIGVRSRADNEAQAIGPPIWFLLLYAVFYILSVTRGAIPMNQIAQFDRSNERKTRNCRRRCCRMNETMIENYYYRFVCVRFFLNFLEFLFQYFWVLYVR